ncbi:MAG: cell division protein FtsX [Vicinamibacterales bacterium]
MRLLRYAFDEALSSIWRGRGAGLLSTATIAVALFVLGAFLIVTSNLQRLTDEWSSAAELSVYLTDDVDEAARASIEQQLKGDKVVAAVEFVSKGGALDRFKETFDDLADTVSALEHNPLPASFDVRLRAGASHDQVEALAATLRGKKGVDDVRYDRDWIDRLTSAIGLLRLVGFVLAGMLLMAAALTVGNVVSLALVARRDELDIMELVGAPTAYVRGPFVMEGALHGGLGAVLAIGALGLGFFAIRGRLLAPLAEAIHISGFFFLGWATCVLLVIGGLAVGSLAGLLASRRA